MQQRVVRNSSSLCTYRYNFSCFLHILWFPKNLPPKCFILRFITCVQVPGTTTYSLALYYMMDTPLEDSPLLESFVNGDDAYRNSRFKLIPYISKVCFLQIESEQITFHIRLTYFSQSCLVHLAKCYGTSTFMCHVRHFTLLFCCISAIKHIVAS